MAKQSVKTKVALKVTSSILQLVLNVIFYLLVIMILLQVGSTVYDFSYQVFGNVAVEAAPGAEREIVIQEEESSMSIARKLEQNKLIVNRYSFYVRAKIDGGVILPGTYTLKSSMTYDNILDVICQSSVAG